MRFRSINVISIVFWLVCSCTPDPQQSGKDPGTTGGFQALSPEQTGVQFHNAVTEDLSFNFLRYPYIYNGGGVAAGDIDNDGRPDLYFTANQGSNRLYLNKGQMRFEDITVKAGVADVTGWSTGVTMADFNGDGWLDIYVCKSASLRDAEARRNKLFINNGDLTFTEQAAAYGLDDPAFSTQAYPFDFDRDGDLDLYLVNHREDFRNNTVISSEIQNSLSLLTTDKLYRNDGGRFTDVTAAAGIANKAWGLSAAIGDFNGDGWDDIYVCNDFLEPDRLLLNLQDGTFRDGIHDYMDHISFYSMGSDLADINNDLEKDLIVLDMVSSDHERSKRNMASMNPDQFQAMIDVGYHHQYMANMLHVRNGHGFSEISHLAGVAKTDWSWAPLLADLDNDGWNDLFVTNGIHRDVTDNDYKRELQDLSGKGVSLTLDQLFAMVPAAKIPNAVYRNTHRLQFEDVSAIWELDDAVNSNGVAWADLDGDGDLDLALNNMHAAASILENRHAGNSLRIRFEGPQANPFGIGASATVYAGDMTQERQLYCSRGFQSSMEPILHFGLGDARRADSVRISWPDGRWANIKQPKGGLLTVKYEESTSDIPILREQNQQFIFIQAAPEGLEFSHRENPSDDYRTEILLPQRQSALGPVLASADVNGDGLADLYAGGAQGQPSALFLQEKDGTFRGHNETLWRTDAAYEDQGAAFFDIDGDGDQDLYVSSGGHDLSPGDAKLSDRLYLNDGQGNFTRSRGLLPDLRTNSTAIAAADIDGDGDPDLVVAGRTVPGKYPFAEPTYLLLNEGGRLRDATPALAPELAQAGLINAVVFTDGDGDGDPDLLLAGEWTPLQYFENTGGQFKRKDAGLGQTGGWWFSLSAADMDGDGDEDLVAGNLGLNNKFGASPEKPFHVYAADFDGSGTIDIVLSKQSKDKFLPVRGKECSSQQMPYIAEKFPTYRAFAEASLADIYGEESLESALHLTAHSFASAWFENRGDGTYALRELPVEAQISPCRGLALLDVNRDGIPDIVGSGNFYDTEPETVRYDAGRGFILLGDGKGGFTAVAKSGFSTSGNCSAMTVLPSGDGLLVVVGANNGPLQSFRLAR